MIIQIKDESHWHEIRSKHIGASEVSALFNLSPYSTAYAIYHVKCGNMPTPDVNEWSVGVGSAMEPAIAALYAKQSNLDLTKVKEYHECDDHPFLGATLDYRFTSHEGKPFAVEIKHVTTWAWRDHGWSPDKDYLPPHVEFQIVAQLMATGWEEGRVVAFCDGELYTFNRNRGDENVEKIVNKILEGVADMKQRISDRREPYSLGDPIDLFSMGIVCRPDPHKPVLDLTHDGEANDALHELFVWQDNSRQADHAIDVAKAKITQILARQSNDDSVATDIVTSHYRLKRTQVEVKEHVRKASVQTRFKVKQREDSQPLASQPTSTIMAG